MSSIPNYVSATQDILRVNLGFLGTNTVTSAKVVTRGLDTYLQLLIGPETGREEPFERSQEEEDVLIRKLVLERAEQEVPEDAKDEVVPPPPPPATVRSPYVVPNFRRKKTMFPCPNCRVSFSASKLKRHNPATCRRCECGQTLRVNMLEGHKILCSLRRRLS